MSDASTTIGTVAKEAGEEILEVLEEGLRETGRELLSASGTVADAWSRQYFRFLKMEAKYRADPDLRQYADEVERMADATIDLGLEAERVSSSNIAREKLRSAGQAIVKILVGFASRGAVVL